MRSTRPVKKYLLEIFKEYLGYSIETIYDIYDYLGPYPQVEESIVYSGTEGFRMVWRVETIFQDFDFAIFSNIRIKKIQIIFFFIGFSELMP